MYNYGEKRKKSFKKAKKKLITWETICKEKYSGTVGRFKKDSQLNCQSNKTNSSVYGDKNYKYGDRKKYEKTECKINDYRNGCLI